MIQTDSDVRDGQATRGNKRILLLVLGLGIALTAAGVFFYAQPRAIEFHEQHYDPDDRKIDRPMDGDSIEITEFRGPKKASGITVLPGRYVLRGKHTTPYGVPLTLGFTGGRTTFKNYRQTDTQGAQSGASTFEIEFYVDGFQPLPITPQAWKIQWKLTGQGLPQIISADLSEFDGRAGLLAVILPPNPDPYLGRKGDRAVLVPKPPGDNQ